MTQNFSQILQTAHAYRPQRVALTMLHTGQPDQPITLDDLLCGAAAYADALQAAAIQPGEVVAILGAGGAVGLLHQQLALQAGARQIIAIGHSDTRLEVARQLGAAITINAHREDTVQAVRELSGGYGADVVIECAGTQHAWETAVETVRRGGRVLWFGGLPAGTRVSVDAARVHYGEINLINIHGGTAADSRTAFDLIVNQKIQVQPLISGQYPLEQLETALHRMANGEALKIAILPDLRGA